MRALKYDYDFDPEAENVTAAAIFRAARAGGKRVLDLGSGPAVVSSRLARDLGFDVVCLDADVDALTAARERGVAVTHSRDLGSRDWAEVLAGEQFDQVILADVLEHLPDPASIIREIADRGLLSDDGRLIVSVPNAGHEAVVASLLTGDFEYTTTGILDETHVRWFTLTSLRRVLEREGFRITRVERTRRTLEQTDASSVLVHLPRAVRAGLRGVHDELDVLQYVVMAVPMSSSASAVPQEMLDTVRRDADDAVKAAVAGLRAHAGELEADNAALKDSLRTVEVESQLRTEVLEAQLADWTAKARRLGDLVREERARALQEQKSSGREHAALVAANVEARRQVAELAARERKHQAQLARLRKRVAALRAQLTRARAGRKDAERRLQAAESSRAVRAVRRARRALGRGTTR